MILKKPRDYACFSQFSKLSKLLGEGSALIVIEVLWVQLGYQVEIHGTSGFLAQGDVEIYLRALPIPDPQKPEVMPALLASEWLKPRGEHYECPLFFHYNPEIDKDFIPDDSRHYLFDRAREQYLHESSGVVANVPPDCWTVSDDVKITPAEMNRIVMLVKTVDGILRLGKRESHEYDMALVHTGYRVIQQFTELQLGIILKRLWLKKNARGIPRNTVQLLNDFDNVMIAIMPNDGFLKWARRTDPNAQASL
jgi:hypothetical protein